MATFATGTAVGDSAAATITGTNISSVTVSASEVKTLPSCSGTVVLAPRLGCSAPDDGVFILTPDPQEPVSGDCGTTGFRVEAANGTGIVVLVPNGGTFTVPAGRTCTLHLRQATQKLPVDVDDHTPGAQTDTGVGAVQVGSGFEIDTAGNTVTVNPAAGATAQRPARR